jgi:hypothetical protein
MQLLILVLFLSTTFAHQKVLLGDIQSLILHKGQYTNARRTNPIMQLSCIGGSASLRSNEVTTVQCSNMGYDGNDYTWKCQSELPSDLKLGRVTVSCEGYDYPNDPHVLTGSCGLKYTLDYSENRIHYQPTSTTTVHRTVTYYPTYDSIGELISFFVFLMCISLMFCFR